MLSKSITKLVQYGMETGLVPECEKNYTINLLLDVFHEDEYVEPEESFSDVDLEETLNELLDEAVKRGLIEDSVVYRDLFDTRLMNCLMPRPAQVQKEFWDKYQNSPQEATDYFYKLSQDSNYIRRYRVKKDQKWKVDSRMAKLILPLIFPNRKKIQKRSQQQKMRKQAAIQNVSFVRRMKDMQVVSIIRQDRITESFRSRSTIHHGASSILHMYITMSIASCSTASILR